MHLPLWAWWVLAASVVLALAIMAATILITLRGVKKIKKKYALNPDSQSLEKILKTIDRENHGELLWELKLKSKDALDDLTMEMAINTFLRNSYKKINFINCSEYEVESMKKIALAIVSTKNPDFIFIKNYDNLLSEYKNYFNELKNGGMLFIANASKREPNIKALLNDQKLLNRRHEYMKIGKGVVLIVK